MSNYVFFWLIIAIILGIIESATVNLVTIWFSIGAVAASVVAAFGGNLLIQSAVFTAVSVATLIATRPLAKKLLRDKKIATNADRFINEKAIVVEDIDAVLGTGQVKVRGQIWSAKPDNDERIKCGEMVKINKIEGVRMVVSRI